MGWTPLLDDDGQQTGEMASEEANALLSTAFDAVIALYQARFKRPPTAWEMAHIIDATLPEPERLFVLGGHEDPLEPAPHSATAGMWAGLGMVLTIVTIVAILIGKGVF